MRNYSLRNDIGRALFVLAVLVFLALFLAPRSAHGLERMTPATALGRLLVHEASLPVWNEDAEEWVSQRTGRTWGDDVYIIHEVILRGADRTGMPYVDFAQTYAHRMFQPLTDEERTRISVGIALDGNRWAGFIDPEHLERTPRAWRGPGQWRAHVDAARYAFELAEDVVQYDLDALMDFGMCQAPVDDWGSPRLDHERAERLGLVHVDCGPNTANWGYARPSQIRAREVSGEWPRVDPD